MDSGIIFSALSSVFTPSCLLILFCGTLFGTVIGALPGLGSILALTVCLPMTLSMDSASAFGLLLGTYCGAIYGGSIASILLNVPGTAQSAATNLDGFPLAQQGRAGEALGWVTSASCMGGIISCAILICSASLLARLSTKYGGPIEICALICMGLACIATLSEGNQLKGIMMGIFGLFLSTIGMDPVSSEMRFTFGLHGLSSGIDLLPFIVGLFPLSEVFYRVYQLYTCPSCSAIDCRKIDFPSIRNWLPRLGGMVRSALLGTGIGILPGTGAAPAAFISYTIARETSRNGDNFGKGEPDGVIAAETANNAVTGGAMVPTLALGIPGDAETSLMLAALTIHHITPGVRLMADNPEMVYCIFILLILANFLMIPSGIITVRSFGKLLKIPNAVLLGLIIICSMVGSFICRNNFFDLWAALFIGVCAFGFRIGNFPLSPALIGYILGPQLEYQFSQVIIYKNNSSWGEYMLEHPLAIVLFVIVIVLLVKPLLKSFRQWKFSKA